MGKSQDKGVSAVIVAAGRGRRFGGMKQFFNLKGKPLIYHTIKPFISERMITNIILVVPEERCESVSRMIIRDNFKKRIDVVAGGRLRQDSVYKGLSLVEGGIVAVHDGVRPFVTKGLIRRGVRLCKRYRAVIFGLPISDTVKKVKGNRVVKTLARDSLYLIQTPQFFDAQLLKKAYEKIRRSGRVFTDDSAVVEYYGHPVYIFEGEEKNIKITYRHQLQMIDKI